METGVSKADYPLVSIIIPAYNAGKHIAQTITSALAQTWPNVEIIVVDDNSKDDTVTVANRYNNKISIYTQPENKGASAARNRGLAVAKGKYIQFLDADDLLSNHKITEQVTALEGDTEKLAVCSTVHFPDGENHLNYSPSAYEERFLFSTNDAHDFVTRLWGGYDLNASMIQPGAWLTPRALIDKAGPWNETLSLDDDGEFFARVMLASAGIIKTGGLLYYRKHHGAFSNLSSQKNMQSMVTATLLKCQYIHQLKAKNITQTERAMYRQLLESYIKCYPQNAALCKPLNAELKLLPDFGYRPRLGGTVINTISNIIGWKMARLIQSFVSRLIRNNK